MSPPVMAGAILRMRLRQDIGRADIQQESGEKSQIKDQCCRGNLEELGGQRKDFGQDVECNNAQQDSRGEAQDKVQPVPEPERQQPAGQRRKERRERQQDGAQRLAARRANASRRNARSKSALGGRIAPLFMPRSGAGASRLTPASAQACEPSFSPATVESARNDLCFVGSIVKVSARQFAAPRRIDREADALGKIIRERPGFNAPIVVNTLGAKGSVIYTRGGRTEVPAAKADAIVDTTGAGDAFRAGFYAGLYRERSLRDCAKLGAATASFVIEKRGSLTNIPSWDRVEERAKAIG